MLNQSNKKSFLLFFFLLWGLSQIHAQHFPSKPSPPRLINDYIHLLSPSERASLEQTLVSFDDSSSTQIAVVIISSTQGYPIDLYTVELAQKWGIGQKKKDNGILLLIAQSDRKMYIATGYGLEHAVPDILANRIIENDIIPYFRQNKYYTGIHQGIESLIKACQGVYTNNQKNTPTNTPILFILLFILIIVFFIIIRKHDDGTTTISRKGTRRLPRGPYGYYGNKRYTGGFGGGGRIGGFGGFGGGGFGGGGAGGSW